MTSSVGAGASGNSISGFCPEVDVTAHTVVGQTGLVTSDQDIFAAVNQPVVGEKDLRETGGDPREAQVHSPDQVGGYLN